MRQRPSNPVGKLFYDRFKHESNEEYFIRMAKIQLAGGDLETESEERLRQISRIAHSLNPAEPSYFARSQNRFAFSLIAIIVLFGFSLISSHFFNTTPNPVSEFNERHLGGGKLVVTEGESLHAEHARYKTVLTRLKRRVEATENRIVTLETAMVDQRLEKPDDMVEVAAVQDLKEQPTFTMELWMRFLDF